MLHKIRGLLIQRTFPYHPVVSLSGPSHVFRFPVERAGRSGLSLG
jgi:hypothetical protein